MASVINSARVSAVSLFSAATKGANMIGDTVDMAATGLDMLAVKTRHMHALVTEESELRLAEDLENVELKVTRDSAAARNEIIEDMKRLGISEEQFEIQRQRIVARRDMRRNKPKLSVAAE